MQRRRIKENRAFTLIEIIIGISLSLILFSGISFLFESGLDTWFYGQTQAELQDCASACIERIVNGNDRFDSLRELLDITSPKENEIGFIPWWKQEISTIKTNKKINLELNRSSSSPIPVAQYWDAKEKRYKITEINLYPSTTVSGRDQIAYIDKSANGKKGRIYFYPDKVHQKEAELVIKWDKNENKLYQFYRGDKENIYRFPSGVEVADFRIEYLDGVNNPINQYSDRVGLWSQTPVKALRLHLNLKKETYDFGLRSLVGIRRKGMASTGVLLSEGATIQIPNSINIKTLSIVDFIGVKKNTNIFIKIFSDDDQKTYGVRVNLTLKNDLPWIEGYAIEYPVGKIVFSQSPDVPATRGINFLTFDYSGYYDYGLDLGIEGQVEFKGKSVYFTLEKSSVSGINLLVR